MITNAGKDEKTPLQEKLAVLADDIGSMGFKVILSNIFNKGSSPYLRIYDYSLNSRENHYRTYSIQFLLHIGNPQLLHHCSHHRSCSSSRRTTTGSHNCTRLQCR